MAIKITWYDHYPDGNKEYSQELSQLNGGLNLRDLPQHLKANESPELENLWWENGILAARPGQEQVGGGAELFVWSKYTTFGYLGGTFYPTVVEEGVIKKFSVYYRQSASDEWSYFEQTKAEGFTDEELSALTELYMRGKSVWNGLTTTTQYTKYDTAGNAVIGSQGTAFAPTVYHISDDAEGSRTTDGWAVPAARVSRAVPFMYAGTVTSASANAFPNRAIQDGYWYEYAVGGMKEVYASTEEAFHNSYIVHYDNALYSVSSVGAWSEAPILSGVPKKKGTFFRYRDYLYYKNNGGFYRIGYSNGSFTAEDMTELAYTPTTFLNVDPRTGAGDSYQPANLLGAKRRVIYKATAEEKRETFEGDGSTTTFGSWAGYAGQTPPNRVTKAVYVDGVALTEERYSPGPRATDSGNRVSVILSEAPAAGAVVVWEYYETTSYYTQLDGLAYLSSHSWQRVPISQLYVDGLYYDNAEDPTFTAEEGQTSYQLPWVYKPGGERQRQPGVIGVSKNDVWLSENEYVFLPDTNIVALDSSVAVSEGDSVKVILFGYSPGSSWTGGSYTPRIYPAPTPADPSTGYCVVEMEYSIPLDMTGLMSCPYATTGGGQDSLCILLGGASGQPNAVYWNSNDSVAMNAGYFPDINYQLVGDGDESVTGFGRQYSDIIVLKEHSLYKMQYEILSLDDRDTISFTFPSINGKIGCDLPWSIQLIENNLVFCNRQQGVHILLSASAAYENNVDCISRKINGDPEAGATEGLLSDVRGYSATPDTVISLDDGKRYWLHVNGHVYLWDYEISGYKDPSWFYFTGVYASAFARGADYSVYHFYRNGQFTRLNPKKHSDYGEAFRKVYQTPVLYFGQYNYLKDVRSVLFAMRSATDSLVQVTYDTDYVTRADLTSLPLKPPLAADASQPYLPADGWRFAEVFRRKPVCRHIRHFQLTLSNEEADQDMAIDAIQVFHTIQDKQR